MKKYYKKLKLFLMFMLAVAASLSAAFSTTDEDAMEAVIFDCDGVLVDTEYLKFLAWQEALAQHHISLTCEEYMPFVGHTSKNILLMIEKLKNQEISKEVILLKNSYYRLLHKQGVLPIDKMVELAQHLGKEKRHLGIKLGLASSAPKEEILQNLKQIGLENIFDVILSGSEDLDDYIDDEGKNKPKPYIYLEAARQLAVLPANCLVFEDTSAGIQAATDAGMVAIAVPNSFTLGQDFSKARAVVEDYEELSFEQFVNH